MNGNGKNDVLLNVSDLVISYGSIKAVKGISFEVRERRNRHADRR